MVPQLGDFDINYSFSFLMLSVIVIHSQTKLLLHNTSGLFGVIMPEMISDSERKNEEEEIHPFQQQIFIRRVSVFTLLF